MAGTGSLDVSTTRRGFLNYFVGLGAAGWLATVLYPILRYLRPLSDTGTGGPVKLTAAEVQTIDKSQFVIARSGTRKIIVFSAGGELRALDAKCTHEGCTVQFVPGDSVIWCACHNGKYDLTGKVLAGPPPRPLDRWGVTRDGNVVTLTRPVQAQAMNDSPQRDLNLVKLGRGRS